MIENQLLIFLIQVLVLLGLARIVGELFRRFGHPAVVGEILVGIILGPTILGRFLPGLHCLLFPPNPLQENMLETLAWVGVLMLLLATGLEIDISTAWRQRGPALRIAVIGVFFPLAVGFLCASLFLVNHAGATDKLVFSLFVGAAIAISAIPIISRILHDLDLLKTDLGLLVLSAFALNDFLGWIIFTIVLSIATIKRIDIGMIASILLVTLLFSSLMLTFGRKLVDGLISKLKNIYPAQPGVILTFIFCVALIAGSISQLIGIHAIFGFFLAGIMVGEAKDLSERTRQVINQMVYAILVPIFFANIGLRIDFIHNFDPLLVAIITAIAILGKLVGAWLGALGSDISSDDRYAIAIAHTPGGAMEIVVAVVALQFFLISPTIFVAIVFAAIFSSLLVGPWFQWSIKRRKVINVLDFFLRRAVIADLRSDDRFDVISEVSKVLSEQEHMPDNESIKEAVVKREQLMGTGLEKGIAIPHARIDGITRPVFTFARAIDGIDWDSRDGHPAQLIFMLLTPRKEEGLQVQILSTIAKVMWRAENRMKLLSAKDADELVSNLQDLFRAEGKVIKR